jgi:hypothetical protein
VRPSVAPLRAAARIRGLGSIVFVSAALFSACAVLPWLNACYAFPVTNRVQMQDYADYKVMTQEDRRKLFSLLQVLKRELDGGAKAPAQQVTPVSLGVRA